MYTADHNTEGTVCSLREKYNTYSHPSVGLQTSNLNRSFCWNHPFSNSGCCFCVLKFSILIINVPLLRTGRESICRILESLPAYIGTFETPRPNDTSGTCAGALVQNRSGTFLFFLLQNRSRWWRFLPSSINGFFRFRSGDETKVCQSCLVAFNVLCSKSFICCQFVCILALPIGSN